MQLVAGMDVSFEQQHLALNSNLKLSVEFSKPDQKS
jgi:hypothetical protein